MANSDRNISSSAVSFFSKMGSGEGRLHCTSAHRHAGHEAAIAERVWQNGTCSCGFFIDEQSPCSSSNGSHTKINLLLRSAVCGDETVDDDDVGNEPGDIRSDGRQFT